MIGSAAEGIDPADIASIAIANQRETTVLWDRATGKPLCHALVWQDVRAEALCESLSDGAEMVLEATGLILSPYYSAAKAAHAVREYGLTDYCFGTVDSYLVYRLTGGRVFATDVSNASRTQLMNLTALRWDSNVCNLFGIPESALPEIRHSDASFGETAVPGIPQGVKITGVVGDSHASLYGQGCHEAGMVKTSYGTGSSIMMNVGETPLRSSAGLSSSVGYGFKGKVYYVLEGNITCSADTLCLAARPARAVPGPQKPSIVWPKRCRTRAAFSWCPRSPGWARPTLTHLRGPSSRGSAAAPPARTWRGRRWSPSRSRTRTYWTRWRRTSKNRSRCFPQMAVARSTGF